MSKPKSLWQIADSNEDLCNKLVADLGISPSLARILYNRGLARSEEVEKFLNPDLADLYDPFLLKGMAEAIKAILQAKAGGEKVLVYGDYDVDGVTATSLLLDTFTLLGIEAGFHIPDRIEEGYGLNKDALAKAAAQGYGLVVTVDCGISAVDEAVYARELGISLIITDHHEPPEILPAATAIINPKQRGCAYPFKELAGVGVAFKLAQALFQRLGSKHNPEYGLLDLVTLGSIADMVPLQGENRILVKHGLPTLVSERRVGLQALLEVAGLTGKRIGTGQVAFALAPRINATGRIGDAAVAVQLLRTQDPVGAREMAVYLDSENRARQELESSILAEALAMLEDFNPERDKVIVLARENWHPGVIGIVASRLVERFYRPVILLALEGDEGKGSGRSIAGFNLYGALLQCSDLLIKFGGHKQAAGLAIKAGNIADFRQAMNNLAMAAPAEIFVPKLHVDCEIEIDGVTARLVEDIAKLEPYGLGNPGPVLVCRELKVVEAREVGKEKNHLKLKVKGKNLVLDGIGFSMAGSLPGIDIMHPVDLVFTPEFNEFNGRVSVQMQIKDLRNQAADIEKAERLTDPMYPLDAAREAVRKDGGICVVAYPLLSIATRMAAVAQVIAGPDLAVQVRTGQDAVSSQGIVFTAFEFLAQDLAKLSSTRTKVGLIIIDSGENLREQVTKIAQLNIPVVHTATSKEIVCTGIPNRDRLIRLYQTLKKLAQADGRLEDELHATLTQSLQESMTCVVNGLEIFEEMQILKRKNHGIKRILYFQAPTEKLNLLESKLYVENQKLLEEFNIMDGIG
ncbi:MAG TPA: single-stranded-DNA-specific exonuclease RecJ [Verrucomicrobiae bacterium]|nr:single-stranded-DNA-specific exonuclease RecJ [Verrucomicrobiae bacterium]